MKAGRCCYCGIKVGKRAIVCHAHSDLPLKDPYFKDRN